MAAAVGESDRGLVHARTLLGAIDDHVGGLVHNRPWIADERRRVLEDLALAWTDADGDNWLPALAARPDWLATHLAGRSATGREAATEAVLEFLAWSRQQGLIH